ncbi:hypothetical protein [Streptomyces eurythermus]|uniref:hypothetical protein n=1 Tax=Streptomyces eurythermus TaxID=42237 RepID=UPI0033C81025
MPAPAVGVTLSLVLLFAAAAPVRTVVPLCASAPKRLGDPGLRPRHTRRPGGPAAYDEGVSWEARTSASR